MQFMLHFFKYECDLKILGIYNPWQNKITKQSTNQIDIIVRLF